MKTICVDRNGLRGKTYIGGSPAGQGAQAIQVECLAIRHAQKYGSENSVKLLACIKQNTTRQHVYTRIPHNDGTGLQ